MSFFNKLRLAAKKKKIFFSEKELWIVTREFALKCIGCWSFLSRDSYNLICLILCPENLACSSHQSEAPKIGPDRNVAPRLQRDTADRNVGCTPLASRVLLTVGSSQWNWVLGVFVCCCWLFGFVLPWLSLVVALDLERYYLLYPPWGHLLHPWGCSVLPGRVTICPGWNFDNQSKFIFAQINLIFNTPQFVL